MVKINDLKEYANNLMFEMEENEYVNLQGEFEIFLNWMEEISKFKGIEDIEPLYFPYKLNDVELREDKPSESLSKEEILKNAPNIVGDRVSVPKVVS